jgi:hypothetical protein
MISGMRGLGLPAAYVSGYLRTGHLPDEDKLTGADAMHPGCWCGAAKRRAGRSTDQRHLRRRYHRARDRPRLCDVAPIDGVIFASGGQRLECR